MSELQTLLYDIFPHLALWSAITIGVYIVSKILYKKWPFWWLMPLAITPILVAIIILAFHGTYKEYISGTKWLVLLLGPTIVAFAIPIYQKRSIIKKFWPVLLVGMIVGSLTSILSSWGLATLVGINGQMLLSLLPRSISTPFAMEVSGDIGGIPDLTAIFVVFTGVCGAVIGDMVIERIPFISSIARGALFGIGAHGAGTARATQIGETEGAISGLTMVLVGILNVLLAPLVTALIS